jgi:hypothetical protein
MPTTRLFREMAPRCGVGRWTDGPMDRWTDGRMGGCARPGRATQRAWRFPTAAAAKSRWHRSSQQPGLGTRRPHGLGTSAHSTPTSHRSDRPSVPWHRRRCCRVRVGELRTRCARRLRRLNSRVACGPNVNPSGRQGQGALPLRQTMSDACHAASCLATGAPAARSVCLAQRPGRAPQHHVMLLLP